MATDFIGMVSRFWMELKRRRVIRTTIAYVLISWILIEVSSVVFPALLLPEWSVRMVVAMFILALPVVIVLAWMFDVDRGEDNRVHMLRTSDVKEPEEPKKNDAEIASIAVLPFENNSEEDKFEYIASGIATELHSTFSRIHRLRVASRTSSFSTDLQADDIKSIGRKLNAMYVVSGNIRVAGSRMRVIVELNDAIEGILIWSQTYDFEIDDIFAVQTEIAQSVTNQFCGERLREEITAASKNPTEYLDAWQRVQRARSYILEFTPETLERGIAQLHEAIELDPEYAAAHATLASTLAEKVLNGLSTSLTEDVDAAVNYADRAYALAPTDPFVLKMCGSTWAFVGEHEKSLNALRRAVDTAPLDFGAWGYLGWPLVESGRPEHLVELHEIMGRILEDSPNHPGSPYWRFHRSVAYSCSGDYENAVEFGRQAVNKNQTFAWGLLQLANALGATGRKQDALDAVDQSLASSPLLTVEHYQHMVRMMSSNDDVASRRSNGLVQAGLLQE